MILYWIWLYDIYVVLKLILNMNGVVCILMLLDFESNDSWFFSCEFVRDFFIFKLLVVWVFLLVKEVIIVCEVDLGFKVWVRWRRVVI